MSKLLRRSAKRAIEEKDWPRAIILLKEILSLNPEEEEIHRYLAMIYDKQNDYQLALQHYHTALQIMPDDPSLHYLVGNFFIKHQQWDYALVQFNNCVALDETHVAARLQIANLYLRKENLSEAKKYYQSMLEEQLIDADIYNNLGVIALKENEHRLAIDYFVKALAENEKHLTARNNLAALYLSHDYDENAVTHYEILLQQNPNDLEAHYNIGVAYMSLGVLDKACWHFETLLKHDQKHVASYTNLGAIYSKLNQPEKSLAYYEKALFYAPFDENIQFIVAAMKGEQRFEAAPNTYLKNLFDHYARNYESHIYRLNYQAPEIIREQFKQYYPDTALRSLNILDLGCGTGLIGDVMYDFAQLLIGIDLSEKMLKQAEKKHIYHRLIHQDFIEYLNQTDERFDLIIACDVFCYFGQLDKILSACHLHLKAKGKIIFSVEKAERFPYQLTSHSRFQHHSDYIKKLSAQLDFQLITCESLPYRTQEEQPVQGLFIMMEKK